MAEFTCRFRVDLAAGYTIASGESRLLLLATAEGHRVELVGSPSNRPISTSSDLILTGRSWPTQEDAEVAGRQLADALLLSLVRSKVGVESWMRRAGGAFFHAGLRLLEEKTGHRMLNDSIGLMVYESDPPPVFARTGVKAIKGAAPAALVESFRALAARLS